MAPQPHIQGRTCAGEPGARFFPKPRFALETGHLWTCGGHLWGALVEGTCGGHPMKPQKQQFFNLTVVGKLSCFRDLYFFPKQFKIIQNPAFTQNQDLHWKRDRVSTCPYSMYGLLQPIFPKWFELVLLRPFPMDLHHLWGDPLR